MPATAPAATPAATATPAEPPETGAVGIEAEGAWALTEPAPAAGLTVVGAVPEPGTVELCPDAVLGAGVVPGTLVGAFAPVVEPGAGAVSYTHLRAHETDSYLVCRLLLEKKKRKNRIKGREADSQNKQRRVTEPGQTDG